MQEMGGIRVDVDSIGDIKALPGTLDFLDDAGVKATFFVAMGPDGSGKNLFRYLKRPWALGRARPARFGFGNLVRGIVSPVCMEDCRAELYEIKKRGHEVGLHGYDHYQWIKTEGQKARFQVEKGRMIFEDVFDFAPKSFASPGFTVNQRILSITERFDYSSDFISKEPFYPRINGEKFQTLQVPVSMKSIGEFEIGGANDGEIQKAYKNEIEKNGFFTFYFHPSYEMNYQTRLLRKIITLLKEKKEVRTLGEIAKKWKNENSANL
jgi:peptidoglycan/xylan/chitin deacetylase (PgdA/CDA1 family)